MAVEVAEEVAAEEVVVEAVEEEAVVAVVAAELQVVSCKRDYRCPRLKLN